MILTTTKKCIFKHLPAFKATAFDAKGFYLMSTFRKYFLDKKEPKQPVTSFKVSKLTEYANDTQIMAELGKEFDVTLSQLFHFLHDADTSAWYISYIKDTAGTLWAVGCDWGSGVGCWCVEAYLVTDPGGWGAGRRVFSRDGETSETLSSEGDSESFELVLQISPDRSVLIYEGNKYYSEEQK